MRAFWWSVVIILFVFITVGSCADDKAFKEKQAAVSARVEAMPVKPPLTMITMTPTVEGAMPQWTDTIVMVDPENGCQYLKTSSGDWTPRMAGMPIDAPYPEYQLGCKRAPKLRP